MENYNELCPKFIAKPHINPINNKPIADEEFDYYREVCRAFSYEFIPEKTFELMYKNEYYGRKICKDFMEDDTVNPVTGNPLYRGTDDYNGLLDLCDFYGFNTKALGTKRSIKTKSKRKNVLGELPQLPSKTKLLPSVKRSVEGNGSLLPIPDIELSSPKTGLLPIPKTGLSSPKRITPKIPTRRSEDEDLLTNLKMIAREIPKDEKVKKVVIDNLSTILQKNANKDRKGNPILSGNKNRYGIKQFIFDLLINNEIDLVMQILKFFKLEYIDIAEFLFDFPTYANNESLIINYFLGADPATDWAELSNILETVYESWIIEDKLKLLILLFSSAIAVGNDLLVGVLTETFDSWKQGIQEEIDDMEDFEEKDKIIDLVEIIDTLSIR